MLLWCLLATEGKGMEVEGSETVVTLYDDYESRY
jgi:hypothetical protein